MPMYDAIGYLEKDLLDISAQDFLRVVEAHAKEGVDFMTIHAGINKRAVEAFRRSRRRMNIVSRGGSLLFAWMAMTGNENPFYEYYDDVLDILREYDVTISLGDALRPGCIDDSSDAGQISELIELGALTERAWAKDVQVMIEGPEMCIRDRYLPTLSWSWTRSGRRSCSTRKPAMPAGRGTR